ncbi:MAG TPA: M20/M25/M40 family metallo-hydrolase [Steroidobacteraceae bacterium]|nr:M20/M25/M40 family metallo-hydrolase [Steroidobacteraceae bacterium]
MHPIRSLTALLTTFIVTSTFAAAPADWSDQDLAAAAALRDRAVAGSSAFDHLSSLTTEVGPRLAGSPGDEGAVRWALRKMAALGFSNVRSQDVLVPHWIRGSAEITALTSPAQTLSATALGGSVGTPDEGIEAPVVEVASLDALKAMPAGSLNGRIVFINQNMDASRDGAGYGATVPNRVAGPSEAAKLGAVAVVIRSVGTSAERFAHTGVLQYSLDAPRIPGFALANPDADQLARMLKSSKSLKLHLKSTARELPAAWSANVIGEIPGRERRDEIVLLAAHLDSWDLGQGAIDDGAGVAIVLEAARLISKMDRPPARTIRVVLYAAEEEGIYGAKEYAEKLGDELSKHVLAFEADLGAGPVWQLQSLVAPEAVGSVDKIQQVLAPINVEKGDNASDAYGDIEPLRNLGVPILNLWLDATHYFDVHHTANDTLAQVDRKTIDQSVAAYAVAAYLAATKQGDFGRLAPVAAQ